FVVRGAEHAPHQLRGAWRIFARLDHGAVSGRENSRQRRESEIHGEIPWTDHAHNSLRLILDVSLRAQRLSDGVFMTHQQADGAVEPLGALFRAGWPLLQMRAPLRVERGAHPLRG